MNSSRSEYLAAHKRDSTLSLSIINDVKEILVELHPAVFSWDFEIDLVFRILYDVIGIITGKDTVGEELASIRKVNIDNTIKVARNEVLQRVGKRLLHLNEKEKEEFVDFLLKRGETSVGILGNFEKKFDQYFERFEDDINPPVDPQSLLGRQYRQVQHDDDDDDGYTTGNNRFFHSRLSEQSYEQPEASYGMDIRASTLRNNSGINSLLPNDKNNFVQQNNHNHNHNHNSSFQQQAQIQSRYHDQIEQIERLNLISDDINSQDLHRPLISPITASVKDKLWLSAMSHFPTYVLQKLNFLEPIVIPHNSPWYKKLFFLIRNFFLISIPTFYQKILNYFSPLDFVSFCLIADYFSFKEYFLNLIYVRTSDSSLKNRKMLLEKAAFQTLGFIMLIKFIFNTSVSIRRNFFSTLNKMSNFLHLKFILTKILIKKTFYQFLHFFTSPKKKAQFSTSPPETLTPIDPRIAKPTYTKSHPPTSFQCQLSPHERHKIRKRLFSYIFSLNNIKTGNNFKNGDIFHYEDLSSKSSLSAYELEISTDTDGRWDTTEDDNSDGDMKGNNLEKSKKGSVLSLPVILTAPDFEDPFGSSSEDDGDTTMTDIQNVEIFIQNARKNKRLFTDLVEPVVENRKDGGTKNKHDDDKITDNNNNNNNNKNNNNNNLSPRNDSIQTNGNKTNLFGNISDSDEDDGVLFLSALPGSSYQTKQSFSNFERKNQELNSHKKNSQNSQQITTTTKIPSPDSSPSLPSLPEPQLFNDSSSSSGSDSTSATSYDTEDDEFRGYFPTKTFGDPVAIMGKQLSTVKVNCGVCLCRTKDTAATTCGHVFCWGCILGYVQVKRECPTCRTACSPSELLRLFQFG